MSTDSIEDLARRLRISRCYVRGPGDVGYDTRGEHDKSDGKPVGNVEDERREAAQALEDLKADLRATEQMHRSWHDRALKAEPYMYQGTNADSEIAHWKARAEKAEAVLDDIAKQKLTSEQDQEGDIEFGYDTIIKVARAALDPSP